ncbi:MAG: hypothetical protein ACR2PR_06805 [Pseudohongiellaceae bacterium]
MDVYITDRRSPDITDRRGLQYDELWQATINGDTSQYGSAILSRAVFGSLEAAQKKANEWMEKIRTTQNPNPREKRIAKIRSWITKIEDRRQGESNIGDYIPDRRLKNTIDQHGFIKTEQQG